MRGDAATQGGHRARACASYDDTYPITSVLPDDHIGTQGTVLLIGMRERRLLQVHHLLTRAGYSVRVIDDASAVQAEGLVDPYAVALVIVDGEWLGGQAHNIIGRLRGVAPDVPLVALVHSREPDVAIACFHAGATCCIQLPIPAGELLQMLAQIPARPAQS